MSLLIKGVTAHTALTDKEAAGVIDHADDSVTDGKIASGVGLADTEICKLPVAAEGKALVRGAAAWEAGSAGMAGVTVRKNTQMPVVGSRPQLNMIEGAATDIKIADNPPDDEIDITVSAKYPTRFKVLLPDDAALPTTNPAELATVDGTNFAYKTLDFDHTTEESANWEEYLTPDYLSENIVADIFWESAGAGDAKLGFSVLGREKGETWDAALGVEQTVVTTNLGAGKLNKSRITTFAPGWAPGDVILFKLARKAGDAADTIDANDVRVLKVVVSYTGQFAQAFYPLAEAVELTLTASDAWTDADVSSYVPAGATGVILHVENSGSMRYIGLRKKGSGDDRHHRMYADSHLWAMAGVDENRIFQYYVESVADAKIWLVGYTATGVVFLDTAVEKVPAGFAAWQTIDVSTECPNAIGVIVELTGEVVGGSAKYAAVRKNGSTLDTNRRGVIDSHIWAIVGVDGSQILETYLSDVNTHLFIIGYVTEGAVFPTNGIDKIPGTIDTWVETDCSVEAPSAIMLFFCAQEMAKSEVYGFRKHGSTEDIRRDDCLGKAYAFVPCDSGQKVDLYCHQFTGSYNGAWIMGYATWAGA